MNGWTIRVVTGGLMLAGTVAAKASAQDCQSDDDCEQGFRCELGDAASMPDCPPGQACDDRVSVETAGNCEPEPIACERDEDCPLGLVCEATESVQSCTDSGSGDSDCEPQRIEHEARCVYAPAPCDDDSDCDAGFECLAISAEQTCSQAPCTAGEPCDSEPVCETRERTMCFPVRQDCDAQADCEADYVCVELPEDAQDDAPAGWEDATQACLPEGLALALMGRVDVGGGQLSDSASSKASRESQPVSVTGSAAAGGEASVSEASDEASPTRADRGGGDGCSVRKPGRGVAGLGAAALGFLLLGFSWRRRVRVSRRHA